MLDSVKFRPRLSEAPPKVCCGGRHNAIAGLEDRIPSGDWEFDGDATGRSQLLLELGPGREEGGEA